MSFKDQWIESTQNCITVSNIVDPGFANGVAADLEFDITTAGTISSVTVFKDRSDSGVAASVSSGDTYTASLTFAAAGKVYPYILVVLADGARIYKYFSEMEVA